MMDGVTLSATRQVTEGNWELLPPSLVWWSTAGCFPIAIWTCLMQMHQDHIFFVVANIGETIGLMEGWWHLILDVQLSVPFLILMENIIRILPI